MYASLRPIRSPTLLPIRMKAAETSASSAIADWTPLTVVPRSCTTAEIDTFISDVSTTSTNMAIARRIASRGLAADSVVSPGASARVSVTSNSASLDGRGGLPRENCRRAGNRRRSRGAKRGEPCTTPIDVSIMDP